MNKSQRIYLNTGSTGNFNLDKYVKVRLEQDIETLEFLTMNLTTDEIYQNFNSDYGVLVGRVIANGGIGIPNAKISVFIPLDDNDAENGEILSIYPYTTPRDKNSDGKRYNLLPRVSQFEKSTGTYKPKQPFGSFLIKPELIVNESFLNVYKKYYKYTALTNAYGDYMIFGVPIGIQTIHLSVDITDIGKYSMTPSSMIKAGYPSNLFTKGGNAIKPSEDLADLPNIETQEISVEIVPFWGDVENFEIGITRQDFRIKAILSSDFIIFGTTMTMGQWGIIGNPAYKPNNFGFYSLDTDNGIASNEDIRTYRSVPPIIQVFTYEDIPVNDKGDLVFPSSINFDSQIRELDKSEYFEYNVNGQFLLNIPCNRHRVITSDDGSDKVVDENSSIGVFTRFHGMILIKYPSLSELTQDSTWSDSNRYNGPNPQRKARGWFKIPQTIGLVRDENTPANKKNNNDWRKEYQTFTGGSIYSVAQFYPTKWADGATTYVHAQANRENTFYDKIVDKKVFSENNLIGGMWFKTQGVDIPTTRPGLFDALNYLKSPIAGGAPEFIYDLAPNIKKIGKNNNSNKYFGGQWLNFCLEFPCYGWAFGSGTQRNYSWADIYHNDYTSGDEYFVRDNKQKIFANLINTKNLLKGDAFQTAFIEIPRKELQKLFNIKFKGIRISGWNDGTMESYPDVTWENNNSIDLDAKPYKYLKPKTSYYPVPPNQKTSGREYNRFGWDEYYNPSKPTAYLFKGMFENDCIKMVSDFGII